MPLRRYFQQLVDLRGPEALSRPDIDELLAAEGAFDALPALRFITRTAARSGILASLAKAAGRGEGGEEEARRAADSFLAHTGFRPDMARCVLDAAAASLGKPSGMFDAVRPYRESDDEPAAEAAEPLLPYGTITADGPLTDSGLLSRVTAAIEIRRDNEPRRGARISNPCCVLADRDSLTITFELSRLRNGAARVAVARYAVYDAAGRVADTDFAGDITPGDISPLPVKRTIPVGPETAARIVLFLD